MKVKKFEIYNFQGIKELSVESKNQVSVLTGSIGKGKSSILRALRFAFTGELPDNAVRDGESEMAVAMMLDSGDYIERHKTEKGTKVRMNGKTITGKNLLEFFETSSGVKKDAMNIITSKEVLEQLTPADFSSFLLRYIPEKLNVEKIEAYIPMMTSEAKEELEKAFPAMPVEFDMEAIGKAYNYFFEQRSYINKEIDRLKKILSTMPEEAPKRALADVEKLLEQTLKRKGEQEAIRKTLEQYKRVAARTEMQKKQIESLSKKLEANKEIGKPDAKKKKALDDALEEAVQREHEIRTLIAGMTSQLRTEMDTLNALKQDGCPLCEEIKCPVDKTPLINNCKDRITSFNDGIEIQRKTLEVAQKQIATCRENISEFRNLEIAYQEKLRDFETLDTLKKSLPELPGMPEVDETEETRVRTEINILYKELDAVKAYERALKDKELLDNYLKKYNIYNYLLDELKPKGNVINRIIEDYFSLFKSSCDVVSDSMIPGFYIDFENDDGVKLWVTPGKGKSKVPYSSLSSGERVLASFVILDMLNQLTGFNILLLDDIEHLDKETVDRFLSFIVTNEDLKARYDNIFLAGASHNDIGDTLSRLSSQIDVIAL